MVDKSKNTKRDNPSRQTINEKTIIDEEKSSKSIIGWILVALLIVVIVVLTFLFRKDVLIESAKQFIQDNEIEVNEELIIEAEDLEDGEYKTGLSSNCVKESYVLITKDEEDNLKYEPIIICDDVEPTIELIGDKEVTVNINGEYKELGAKAEIGSKDITDRIVIDSKKLDTNKVGTYEIKYTITDKYGNSASTTRKVEVIDHIAPEIALYGGYTISMYYGLTYREAGYIATDNVDGNITSNVTISGTVNTRAVGTYSLTYSVEDAAGNKKSVTRTIHVIPVPAPTLSISGGNIIYHEAGTAFNDPGAVATDPIMGNITGNIEKTGTVDVNKLGTYTLTYKVTGTNGTVTTMRSVKVVDRIAPTVKLIGDREMTLIIGVNSYTEQGVTTTDNFDKNPTTTITGTVDDTQPGTYVITYTGIDSSGNKTTITRTVNVRSVESIEITTPADKTTYNSGEELDITGLVVTATLDNGDKIEAPITENNVTGFNSSAPIRIQPLTITYLGKTATYDIEIIIASQEGMTRPNIDDVEDYETAYEDAGLSTTQDGNTITVDALADLTGYAIPDLLRREGNPQNPDAYIGIVFTTPNVNATKVEIDIDGTQNWRTVDLTDATNDNTRLNNQAIIYFEFANETTPGTWTAVDDSHSLVFRWYDSSNNLILTTTADVVFNLY